jgi:hypothetical protein
MKTAVLPPARAKAELLEAFDAVLTEPETVAAISR